LKNYSPARKGFFKGVAATENYPKIEKGTFGGPIKGGTRKRPRFEVKGSKQEGDLQFHGSQGI